MLFTAGNAAAFHLGYSWLPSFFVQQIGISTRQSLWMLLTCMVGRGGAREVKPQHTHTNTS